MRRLSQGFMLALCVMVQIAPALAAAPALYQWTLTGTGFVVNPAGNVVTNAHVVKDCHTISVLTANGEESAQLVAADIKRDLAVLKTPFFARAVAPMRWQGDAVRRGDTVTLMGYPGEAGTEGRLTARKTRIVGLKGPDGQEQWLQLAHSAAQGNSGGPVLDQAGNVIAMLTGIVLSYKIDAAGEPTGAPVSQTDYAFGVPVLQDFLRVHGIGYDDHDSGFSSLDEDRLRAMARQYIVRVRCVQDAVAQ